MRHVLMVGALAALTALAAGCAPEVPDEPTWREDVRPILLANCTRCHGTPPLGGAPSFLRLDRYEAQEERPDGTVVEGATAYTALIAEYVDIETMPPEYPLWPRQQDVILNWVEAGAPEGPPIEGNRAPTMELGEFERDGDLLVADYSIDDADDDLVTGYLFADPDPEADNDELTVTFELFSGQSQVVWDVGSVPPGNYQLRAEIEDGSGAEESIDLGSTEVDLASAEVRR